MWLRGDLKLDMCLEVIGLCAQNMLTSKGLVLNVQPMSGIMSLWE